MKKLVGLILVAVIVVFGAGVASVMAVWSAENKVTDDFVARVNRFAIPPSWTQLSEIVRGEQLLCMSTNPCPSMSRRWSTDIEFTPSDLLAIASPAGITLKVDSTCQRQTNVGGVTPVCTGTGNDSKYVYYLTAVSPGVGEKQDLVLNAEPLP